MSEADSRPEKASLTDAVRKVWETVLGTRVHDDADFFALGGDSLAALSITALIEQVIQPRPAVRLLFDHPRFVDYLDAISEATAQVSR